MFNASNICCPLSKDRYLAGLPEVKNSTAFTQSATYFETWIFFRR